MPARATSQPPTSTSTKFIPFVAVPARADPAVPAHTDSAAPVENATSSATTVQTMWLPTVQANSPLSLAARVEQLPGKPSGTLADLARMPRLRGVRLRSDRTIVWD